MIYKQNVYNVKVINFYQEMNVSINATKITKALTIECWLVLHPKAIS